MEDIGGMLNYFGGNFTVSDIRSALILVIYDTWHVYWSISGPMYQPSSPCGSHYALLFVLLYINIIVPGGANGVQL